MDILNADQQLILNHVLTCLEEKKRCSLFIQGVAGTGKSFLINEIKNVIDEKKLTFIKCAHQAVAALNIDGVTIYKLFGFNGPDRKKAKIVDKDGNCKEFEKDGKDQYECVRKCKIGENNDHLSFSSNKIDNWLVIDEISMVSLEMIDDIDSVLRQKFDIKEFFGGINFIFLGHLSQLKPVKETPIYYSPELHPVNFIKILELKINQRQKDKEFFELCNSVMKSCLTKEQKIVLKSRNIKNFDKEIYKDMVHIYPTKKICHLHNLQKLIELKKKIYFIRSFDEGRKEVLSDADKKMFKGLPNFTVLCVGARVMTTRNFKGFINGQMYIVDDIKVKEGHKSMTKKEFFTKDLLQESDDIDLPLFFKENKNETEYYEVDDIIINLRKIDVTEEKEETEYICTLLHHGEELTLYNKEHGKKYKKKDVVFSRVMYPTQLAWALTTHKIQGITLENAVIDMSKKNFDPVQLYVNISRVKKLQNLYITSLDLPLEVSTDKKIIKKFIERVLKNNEEGKAMPIDNTTVVIDDILDQFF